MSLDITLAKVTYVSDKPSCCPKCGHTWETTKTFTPVYEINITHNLVDMAAQVGLYDALWQPERIRATTAGDLVEPLERGINEMYRRENELLRYNPTNGWGSHATFCEQLQMLLTACRENPTAVLEVSR